MKNVNETRRRFMRYFAGIGLGSTLAPGILWARMQDAGAQKITLAMVTDSLRMAGLEMPLEDRQEMVTAANAGVASVAPLLSTEAYWNEASPAVLDFT